MVKKNLKNALKAHEARKAQASKILAAEEAAKRKAISVRTGKQPKRQRRATNEAPKSYTRPFRSDDTILLVGEGEPLPLIAACRLLIVERQAISPLHIRSSWRRINTAQTCYLQRHWIVRKSVMQSEE